MPEVMEDTACESCGRDVNGDNRRVIRAWNGTERQFCDDCAGPCSSCGTQFPRDDMEIANDTGLWLCGGCYYSCDGCGEIGTGSWVSESRDGYYCCPECRGSHGVDDGSIRGYGHTEGWLWLKTEADKAKAKEDRYYLGWELEIATRNMTATPIMDWAEQHLGRRDAIIGKEDSSVDGFEIVSQPMTPAFFEGLDWEGFFEMLNQNYPLEGGRTEEPTGHGLHVHIGRRAFQNDDIMVAAYAYLLSQSDHLERIARREPTGYCLKVGKPVSVAVVQTSQQNGKTNKQVERLRNLGLYAGRDAINLTNPNTIEIRAFRSTRSASEFRDAVRVVYTAAEYVRSLRKSKIGMAGKSLHWSEFSRWVAAEYPEAFANISGLKK